MPSSLAIRFIARPRELDVLESISSCFSGSPRREDLDDEIGQHAQAVRAWLKEHAARWPQQVQDLVAAALPYDKATASKLRAYLDEHGTPEVQASVGAYVRLGNRFGMFDRLNGNQVRTLARLSWCERGLAEHRMPMVLTCPLCSGAAPASLQFEVEGPLRAWTLRCNECGYHEDLDASRRWAVTEEANYADLAGLVKDFSDIVSRQDPRWLAEQAREHHPQWCSWLEHLEPLLQNESRAIWERLAEMDRPKDWTSPASNKGWTLRLYGHGSFELDSNVQCGYVSPAKRVRGTGTPVTRHLDDVLDDVPAHRLVRRPVEVADAAVHWREELNTLRSLAVQALDANDTVRAGAAVTALAYAVNLRGVVCNILFEVTAPFAELEQAVQQETSRRQAALRAAPERPALAEFLARGLKGQGVTQAQVKALLDAYWTQAV